MRLEESEGVDEVAQLHAGYFAEFAESAEPGLLGDDQTTWITRVEQERHNIGKALEWLDDSGLGDEVLRVAGALRWFWVIRRDISDGSRWLEKGVVATEGVNRRTLARAVNGVGLFALMKLDFARAEQCFREAQEDYGAIGDDAGVARQQYHLAVAAWLQDDYQGAEELADKALEMTRAAGDHWAEGWTLAVRGTMARLSGALTEASDWMDRSHLVFSEFGGILDLGWSHLRLGAIARDGGRYPEAMSQYQAGRDLLSASGDRLGVAHADAALGALSWLAGEHEQAIELYREVLQGFSLIEEASNNLFEMKTMIQGNPSLEILRQVVQSNRERAVLVENDRGAKAAMAEHIYHLGKTAHGQRDTKRAWQAVVESLRLAIDTDDKRGIAIALATLAIISREEEDLTSAAQLFGLAERIVSDNDVPHWPPREEPEYREHLDRLAAEFDGFTQETETGSRMSPAEILGALV